MRELFPSVAPCSIEGLVIAGGVFGSGDELTTVT